VNQSRWYELSSIAANDGAMQRSLVLRLRQGYDV